jgi:tetratricopeptide (TPR) repeat protein
MRIVFVLAVAMAVTGPSVTAPVPQREPAPPTTWEVALDRFRRAGRHVGRGELDQADAVLALFFNERPSVYQEMAARHRRDLALIVRGPAGSPKSPEADVIEWKAHLCLDLCAYEECAELTRQAIRARPDRSDPCARIYPWVLVEVPGARDEAITEYRRLLDAAAPDEKKFFQERIELLEQRPARSQDIDFGIRFIELHYLQRYWSPAERFLPALAEVRRLLPLAQTDDQRVRLHRTVLNLLSDLRDTAGQTAWEDQILAEWRSLPNLSAEILHERGRRRWQAGDKDRAHAALSRLCREQPRSPAARSARLYLGEILQARGERDAAAAEYAAVFEPFDPVPPTELRVDVRYAQHSACLRLSELHAEKKDFAKAMSYVLLARDPYWSANGCGSAVLQEQKSIEDRLNKLKGLMAQPR